MAGGAARVGGYNKAAKVGGGGGIVEVRGGKGWRWRLRQCGSEAPLLPPSFASPSMPPPLPGPLPPLPPSPPPPPAQLAVAGTGPSAKEGEEEIFFFSSNQSQG